MKDMSNSDIEESEEETDFKAYKSKHISPRLRKGSGKRILSSKKGKQSTKKDAADMKAFDVIIPEWKEGDKDTASDISESSDSSDASDKDDEDDASKGPEQKVPKKNSTMKSKSKVEGGHTKICYSENKKLDRTHALDGITSNLRNGCTSFEAIVVAAFNKLTVILVKCEPHEKIVDNKVVSF
jgi:hypothetical protein